MACGAAPVIMAATAKDALALLSAASAAGAAGSGIPTLLAWKRLLLMSMTRQSNPKTSTFVQVATVRADGTPANRTVVYRGFVGDSCHMLFYTDTRSSKVEEVEANPNAEVCWYFPDTWEQFRISGQTEVVGTNHASQELTQLRTACWQGLSERQKKTWMGPHPGTPRPPGIESDVQTNSTPLHPAPHSATMGPEECFCLLFLHPHKVDYLSIKEDWRSVHSISQQTADGSSSSSSEKWDTVDVYA